MRIIKLALALAVGVAVIGCSDQKELNNQLSRELSLEFPELGRCLEEPATVVSPSFFDTFSRLQLCNSRMSIFGKCLGNTFAKFSFDENKKRRLYGAEIIPHGDDNESVQVLIPKSASSSFSFQDVSNALKNAARSAVSECELEAQRQQSWNS